MRVKKKVRKEESNSVFTNIHQDRNLAIPFLVLRCTLGNTPHLKTPGNSYELPTDISIPLLFSCGKIDLTGVSVNAHASLKAFNAGKPFVTQISSTG